MATVTIAYNVHDIVYHVGADTGVRQGVVTKATATVVPSGVPYGTTTTISYLVSLTETSQSVTANEASLFDDIDSALAEYKNLILLP